MDVSNVQKDNIMDLIASDKLTWKEAITGVGKKKEDINIYSSACELCE